MIELIETLKRLAVGLNILFNFHNLEQIQYNLILLLFLQLNGRNTDIDDLPTLPTKPIDTKPQFSYLESLREEQQQQITENETNYQQYEEQQQYTNHQEYANNNNENEEDNLFEFSPNTQRRINALSRGDMSEYANVVKCMNKSNDEENSNGEYQPSSVIPMKISDPIAECGNNEVVKSTKEDKEYFTQSQKQSMKSRLSQQEKLYYETKNKINSLMRETV